MRRFEYIDIAKGMGILLVVWGHIFLTGVSHRVIYAFHMPLFFLISGMLFKRDKFGGFVDFLKRRAKRLLVPFVIYSVVTWIIWAAFRFIRHDAVVSYWDPLLQTIIAKGSGAYMVHNSALWFIPCLFATEIIYFTLSKCNDFVKFIISTCFATVSFTLGHYFADDWWFLLPWNLDAAMIAVLFYCIGNIFSSKISNFEIVEFSKNHIILAFCLFLVLSGLLYWSSMEFGECSMGSSSYNCNGVIFIVRALIGTAACILLSVFIGFMPVKNILKKYLIREGKCSLDVMSIHIPIKGIVIMGLALLIHHTSDDISESLIYSAIAFVITMIIVDMLVQLISKGKQFYKQHIQACEE